MECRGPGRTTVGTPRRCSPMDTATRMLLTLLGATLIAGRSVEAQPQVTAPPESFFELVPGRDRDAARQFYEKYLDVNGIPVVAAARVEDEALRRAREIVGHMLAGRPDVVEQLV